MTGKEKKPAPRFFKKSRRGLVRILFSRVGLVALLVLVEIGLSLALLLYTAEVWPPIFGGTMALSVIMAIYLLNVNMDPTAKITWLLVFTLFPVFGALLFVYTRSDFGHRVLKRRTAAIRDASLFKLPSTYPAEQAFAARDARAASLLSYLRHSGCYPVFDRTEVRYFPSGEDMFAALLTELERAEKFIFLEYFIIAEGQMWNSILEILARKAKSGVEVRVMYDGTCEFTSLTHAYPRKLRQMGIAVKLFAPIKPFVSTHYNYRDHRKILVIDGRVAFTGGVNLSDEYINAEVRFGHWKDAAVMLSGDGALSFTQMFLDMWDLDRKEVRERDAYFPKDGAKETASRGFVLPYADCPLDAYKAGERVYMDILSRAQDYVHIMTPYLILDGEMENALRYAALRGVDVSLILPGIPDKKMPYALAKTYYADLLEAGVKIYEYTPGFVHAKVFVADGREAVVGTVNLDYRSFYHHFECAVYLYDVPCIPEIEADFCATREMCRTVTNESRKKEKLTVRLLGALARAIAPLL